MTDRPDTQGVQTNNDDARLIAEIFSDLGSAFAEHDAAKFDERFTADIVFTAVNGTRFFGWEEIHAYHNERLTGHAEGINTWYEIERITFPTSDVAVVFFRQPIVVSEHMRANVGTWVLVKREGQWWISAGQNTAVAVTE
ncbi:SgcJ/EcaC family oxidoreductase [Streptomyces angustmyceticus]|uniref:SgcJ/EcaC family oxidoreductase n=1 Tax=Streptomyces angustmyceticus TaxID=285578 RepID=UPI0034509ADA